GLRTGSVRKPEGRDIVVRNRQTKACRRKTQAGHRRGQLKAPLAAIPREHMRSRACRPRNRTVGTKCDLRDPALLVIGGKLAMIVASGNFDEPTIVATRDDAGSVGCAGQNSARMNPEATFGIPGEQKCFLAKHEYRGGPNEVHADDGRGRVD